MSSRMPEGTQVLAKSDREKALKLYGVFERQQEKGRYFYVSSLINQKKRTHFREHKKYFCGNHQFEKQTAPPDLIK